MTCFASRWISAPEMTRPSSLARSITSSKNPGCASSASRTLRASWTCLRVRPSSAVVGLLFPSGTILGWPTVDTSPRSCAASYSSASRRLQAASASMQPPTGHPWSSHAWRALPAVPTRTTCLPVRGKKGRSALLAYAPLVTGPSARPQTPERHSRNVTNRREI